MMITLLGYQIDAEHRFSSDVFDIDALFDGADDLEAFWFCLLVERVTIFLSLVVAPKIVSFTDISITGGLLDDMTTGRTLHILMLLSLIGVMMLQR